MINKELHKASHDNEYVEWETEEIDYNMIEKSLSEMINSPFDPENYFKKEVTICCLLYTSPSQRDQRGERRPGGGLKKK